MILASDAAVCECVCVCVRMCVHVCIKSKIQPHTIGTDTGCIHTMNVFVFQISPGVETLGLPAPSTQSLPHSTEQPLTKNGVFHQPAVGYVVTSAVQLGRGQIPASVSSHLTKT